MNKSEQPKRLLLFAVVLIAILMILVACWIFFVQKETVEVQSLSVTPSSGFYTQNQLIEVKAPKGAVVYYTDNGEVPGPENGVLYTEAIPLEASEEERVYTYRFKAYYADGSESEIIPGTYFLGQTIDSRYTTNVLHITGEPEGLFGYEEGILVRGKLYDEYMAANPGEDYGSGIDANFMQSGPEWERAVSIECFSHDGKVLFDVNGGVRVHGALTRLKNQKSLRLYARKEYDEQNEFEYPIITGLVSASDGTVAKEHKRLIVRNAGNDNGYAFIRSELICELASDAGFPDVMHSEPICVYVNGMYQGIYWLENTFDAQYFENVYGLHTGEFVVLEGQDALKTDDTEVQKYVDEYNDFYAKYAGLDLTMDRNYEELCKALDVENYLQYFAIECYVGNVDWPDNNVKVYRYVTEEGDYREGTVFDGRYRHLLFDVDYGFGLLESFGYTADTEMLEIAMEGSPLFTALMEREDCRQYFVNYTCDLMNGAMSPAHVEKVLSSKRDIRDEELFYMLEKTDINKDSWSWEELSEKYDVVEEGYGKILKYAANRQQPMLRDMLDTFGYDAADAYTLYVNKQGLSAVNINTLYMDANDFEGVYLGNIPVVLTPALVKNETFSHWVVNGEIRTEEELVLTTKDMVEYEVRVEMITESVAEPILQIYALRAKGNSDYIELINLSDKAIHTGGYFLSDCEDMYRCALPDMTIEPGATKRFYGKDCMDAEGLGELGLNFNIKQGENVSLTYREQMVETIVVPDLSADGVYQRVGAGDKFREIME